MRGKSKCSWALAGVLLALALLFVLALLGAPGGVSTVHADPGTLYVAPPPTGSDLNDCQNPGAPCATVVYALGQAANGDEIWIAGGTYTETVHVAMTVTLKGGYEATGWTRDIEAHPTIVEGNGADSPVISTYPGVNATFEGLTVQGANHTTDMGGGVFVNDATVVISATVLQGNSTNQGGGIWVEGSSARLSLIGSQVVGNAASQPGGAGGLHCSQAARVSVRDTVFRGNSGSNGVVVNSQSFDIAGGQVFSNTLSGGGAVTLGGSGTISGTEVVSNTGQGLLVQQWGRVTAENLTLRGNTVAIDNHGTLTVTGSLIARNAGAWTAVGSWNNTQTSRLVMDGCIVAGNTTTSTVNIINGQATIRNTQIVENALPVPARGAIVWLGEEAPGPEVELVNVLVADNLLDNSHVVRNQTGSGVLMNVTLAGNETNGPGNVLFAGDTATLTNVIVWGNPTEAEDRLAGPGTLSVSYSDIEGGWTGTGNINADPRFVDAAGGDYHLWVGSPCTDKGTPAGAPTHDLEGTPRDARPDMGAYEWTGYRVYLPLVTYRVGVKVHVLVGGGGQDAQFDEAMHGFEEKTGIDLVFEGVDNFEQEIVQRAQMGDLPDVALFPQPGLLGDLARDGHTIDLYDWFSLAYLQGQYEQSWLDMATVDGEMAGVWFKANVKSLVWYPLPEFQDAGYTVPQNWTELIALSDQMVADGRTPWCIGIASDGATGWVGTDWVEDILLRTTTPANYDAWVRGDLPFASPEVRNAWQRMGQIWFTNDYVLGGRPGILNTWFGDAPLPMFDDPPGCWLHRQATFISGFFPEGAEYGVDYDYFYFPSIDAPYDDPVLIAGDLFGVFHDRPEVRDFVEYVTRGDSVRWWVERAMGVSPHKDADLGWYTPEAQGYAQMLMDAETVRFDGSDLMPGVVGTNSFWQGIVDYVNGVSLDLILATIDASWPD